MSQYFQSSELSAKLEAFSVRDEGIARLISQVCEAYSPTAPCVAPESLPDVVSLLNETDTDQDMSTVAVLRGVEFDSGMNIERIRKKFGHGAEQLYRGALQLDGISLSVGSSDIQNTSAADRIDLSKVLIAVVDDPRVVTIQLAELLVRMRNARDLPEHESKELANQVLSVHTRLANKLGMWRMKWELEDLSFKCLNRTEFNRIARQLDERRIEREKFIEEFVERLQNLMDKTKIRACVNGRAKHIYGIWKKQNRKNVNFDDIYDVRAVRILVKDVESCYAALGAVHARWIAVSAEYDDYIATPKVNGYQSLHTAVYGPNDKIVEVQIRTEQMHNDCEYGVAAHWKYKDASKSTDYQSTKVTLLRQLMDWRSEVAQELSTDVERRQTSPDGEIYVFSPAGKVVELPSGATPIDFAYAIHTEVGHRCRGATVNGKIVPLTTALKTGDWVEIRTANKGGPSRDWLSSHHKYVNSTRAKSQIRRWFKLEEYGRYQSQGKAALDREFLRHGMTKVNLDKLAADNGFRRSGELLAAVGMGELKPAHAVAVLLKKDDDSQRHDDDAIKAAEMPDGPVRTVSMLGVDNLLTHYALCCRPLPGDDVLGYVTTSRGITVHRSDCGNIERMLQRNPDRMVSVELRSEQGDRFPVELELIGENHPQLSNDVVAAISELGCNLTSVNTSGIKSSILKRIELSVEIENTQGVKTLLRKLRSLDRVERARRVGV